MDVMRNQAFHIFTGLLLLIPPLLVPETAAASERVTTSLSGGITSSDTRTSFIDTQRLLGGSLKLMREAYSDGHYSVTYEAGFVSRGSRSELGNDPLPYLHAGAMIRRYAAPEPLGSYFAWGWALDVLLKEPVNGWMVEENMWDPDPKREHLSAFDIILAGEFGWVFSDRISFGLRYEIGLIPINNKEGGGPFDLKGQPNNSTLSLSLNYRIW